MELTLHKYDALGNTFLIALASATDAVTRDQITTWCKQYGTDGFYFVTKVDGEIFDAHLRNADGSKAEISGNGSRCVAQCLIDNDWATEPSVTLQTGAGLREVVVGESIDGVRMSTVSMGVPSVTVRDGGSAIVDVGNPHLVLANDDGGRDINQIGPWMQQQFAGGINVELVTVKSPNHLVMDVWERGVGITQACGSGATAVAAAVHAWERGDEVVTVTQPGGDVSLQRDGESWLLTGPSVFVASYEVAL